MTMPVHYLPHEAELALQLTLDPDRMATARVEKRIRLHYGFCHAVAVGDLHHAFLALGMAMEIGPGDEVVVSPLESRGLAALSLLGATMVPAMLNSPTLLVDDVHLAGSLAHHTRLVVVPHTGGLQPDFNVLCSAAAGHGAPMMVSLTGLIARSREGIPPSHCADVVIVDLGPDRAITAGQGAVLLTSNSDLHDRILRVVAPAWHQWANGLSHVNTANLECPLPPSAALLLERTWDHQFHRLADKQRRLRAALHRHRHTFLTWPFEEPGVCTFEHTLLNLQPGTTTPLKREHLHFFYRSQQRFRPYVQWRVPPEIGDLLNALSGLYAYYRLEDVVEKQWPCY